ncbi:MAG: MiaB/RimO family radical SAM methylthiotransferase [Gemmatimonadaceae bacterium]|nr:MiaB/RimO family radical SAM methylthiotransferase [Gemmatimonadaceae bacterium]
MKVHLRTFGCRANHYDTEQVRALVAAMGASESDAADADVAVLNSCAVTSDAEADLRQAVRRIARESPGTRIVVTGCAAARSHETIAQLPNVTHVIAGADVAQVALALGGAAASTRLAAGEAATALLPLARRQSGARATLRVQDGCDEHCTFCATTLARGAHRSRDIATLVDEARGLAEHHPEIVITGVHVGSYGTEHGESIGVLVETLVREVPTVRFRLASVEATEVDPTLFSLLRDGGDRVCPYLHAPLQSGSDRVLRRMGRHWYTARTYAEAITRLTADRTVFGLGADIMTGFPGETAADHAETVALVRDLPFTHLHVFPFSPRPGTAAERLGDPVQPSVARERAAELRAIADEKQAAYAASRAGGIADVVVIGGTPVRTGLTEDYLEVEVAPDRARATRFAARLTAAGTRLRAQ